MKNDEKQLYLDNPIYKSIIDDFENVARAGRKLGLTRKVIYDFINTGSLSQRAKNRIIAAGYNPETLKPEFH